MKVQQFYEDSLDERVEEAKKNILRGTRRVALASIGLTCMVNIFFISIIKEEPAMCALAVVWALILTLVIKRFYTNINLDLSLLDIFSFSNGVNHIDYDNKEEQE